MENNEELPNDMVFVEGGTMTLGSDFEDDEDDIYEVELDSFYISKYAVTQELYESITGENPSNFKGNKRPVEMVSWYDAVEFCNKLSEKDGLKPCYNIDKEHRDPNDNSASLIFWTVTCDWTANGYRLPTDAEWEYAARGGKKSKGFKYAGSDNPDEVAWYSANSGNETHDVGGKAPNELGLYDMCGNTWEWCWDWFSGAYNFDLDRKNPKGHRSGSQRSVHGGEYSTEAKWLTPASRSSSTSGSASKGYSFRLVRSGK